jgi:3-isopropylmalate/(R)-2-methylmalate dehydratase small subunit
VNEHLSSQALRAVFRALGLTREGNASVPMEKFNQHTGVGVPLRRSDVDTDQIIPAVYLKRVTRTGFEDALFAAWRGDPAFVLNQPAYASGSVLVAGPDFGTGSSREHAVWALKDFGFRVVISARFADIFRGNAGKQGLLAAVCAPEDVELLWKLLESRPGTELTVDLESATVSCDDVVVPFQIDPYTRWRLMEGLDDIGLTLNHADEISAFEATRASWRPRTLPAKHLPPVPIEAARPVR